MSHNAAREIHIATGHSKGIDNRRINDFELVFEFRAVRYGGHLLTFILNKTLQSWVLDQAKLGNYLRVGLLPQCYLLTFRHQANLLFARDGVGRAGRQ